MKKKKLIISVCLLAGSAILVLLSGCAVPAGQLTPTQIQIVPEAKHTEDAIAAEDSTFMLYLLEGEIAPGEIDPESALVLMDQPLSTMEDIVSYDAETHHIRLTENGVGKLKDLQIPVNGMAFVVCVNGEAIYQGAFWVAFSSLSYDGVVIDPLMTTLENPVIQISLGYPAESFFTGDDPRSDPRIMEALDERGKLKR